MSTESFYTPTEVAARLKVQQRTVMEWLRSGRLRGVKLGPGGRLWRIRAEDLDAFLEPAHVGRQRTPKEDAEWRRRLAVLQRRIAGRMPAGVTPEEIEAEITAARDEVREERRAARRR